MPAIKDEMHRISAAAQAFEMQTDLFLYHPQDVLLLMKLLKANNILRFNFISTTLMTNHDITQ